MNKLASKFAVFSDILLSKNVLTWLDLPLEYKDKFSIEYNSETPIKYVYRVEYSSKLVFEVNSTELVINYENKLTPLYGRDKNYITDIEEAGDIFVNALDSVIQSIASSYKKMSLLLSGGIDSATVAYFAHKAGIDLHAFTVGSPWGNEFDNAKVSAIFIGLDLKQIYFSEKQLSESLVDTIKWLGHFDKDIVDIGLTNTCFMKYHADTPRNLITGYGSDLLNAGYFRSQPTSETLDSMIDESNIRTRYTNEFSMILATNYDRDMIHPYWYESVQQAAFKVDPSIKFSDGQDKLYFRNAMARYLPYDIAWRKKVAVHQGGSMQDGLTSYIENRIGVNGAASALYSEIFKILIDLSTIKEDDPMGSSEDILNKAIFYTRKLF